MFAATLVCGMLAMLQAPATEPAAGPRKFALLIGVTDYPSDGMESFRRIHGSTNDVLAVARTLRDEFQFATDDVHVLTNQAATLPRVLDEFDSWLLPQVKSADIVFLYFSGHGSVIPDLARTRLSTEWIGDSSFVLWDSRRDGAAGRHDLTDDQVQSLIAPLVDRGAHVCVVTDACHSAGGTRGGAAARITPIRLAPDGTEGVGAESLPDFWPKSVPFLEDGDGRRPKPNAYVHLAACRKDEPAQEWVPSDGADSASRGVFTMLLLEVLREVAHQPGRWTYEDVHRGVMWRLPPYQLALDHEQNPSPDGKIEQLVFSGAYRKPPGRFVVRTLGPERVEFESGSIAGIEVGTELEVIEKSGLVIGMVRIDSCDAVTCSGAWVSKSDVSIDGTVYADWHGAPPSLGRIVIHDPLGDAERFLGPVEFITFDRTPRYLALNGSVDSESATPDRGRLRVVAPDGVVIVDEPLGHSDALASSSARTRVLSLLKDEISYQQLVRLLGRHSDVEVTVTVRSPTPDETRKRWINVDAMTPLDVERVGLEPEYTTTHDRRLNRKHLGVVDIANLDREPLYVYVVSLMPDHDRELIFPGSGALADERPIEPGEPPQGVYFSVDVPDSWPDSVVYDDLYLVLTSTTKIDIRALMARETLRGGASEDDIPEFLQEALRGERMRGRNAVETATRVGSTGFRLAVRLEQRN
ncbi:MAG: caspase family protein [Planctomycetes bacterium]|nr:caspase family protein [Planctomycetota bacterium]